MRFSTHFQNCFKWSRSPCIRVIMCFWREWQDHCEENKNHSHRTSDCKKNPFLLISWKKYLLHHSREHVKKRRCEWFSCFKGFEVYPSINGVMMRQWISAVVHSNGKKSFWVVQFIESKKYSFWTKKAKFGWSLEVFLMISHWLGKTPIDFKKSSFCGETTTGKNHQLFGFAVEQNSWVKNRFRINSLWDPHVSMRTGLRVGTKNHFVLNPRFEIRIILNQIE